ncbi:biotin/lipoyl-binding protein, partial [Chromobacterium violaceum]|uniref:biotin/lipoyl-binding protein n=1 Tax=Chromobacterium violaceum TaxID=536 RepID=UPI0035ECD083
MNNRIRKAGSVLLTLATVAVAIVVVRHIWIYYTDAPWTRDGHIAADVVQVAPDVSGLITEVKVSDNQLVKKGQVLFVVDRAHYELALRQAEAALAAQRATLAQARREAARNRSLTDLVAAEAREEGDAKVQLGEATLAAAEAGAGQRAALPRLQAEQDAARFR